MTLYANPIEWVFLMIAIVVIWSSVYSMREAMIDAAVLVAHGLNGPRTVLAEQNIREESIKVGIGFVMLCASIAALFLHPPPPSYADVPQSIVSMIAWCVVSALMILSSALATAARRKAQRYGPIEVHETVGTIAPRAEGRTSSEVQAEAQEIRDTVHLRKGDRREDRRQ